MLKKWYAKLLVLLAVVCAVAAAHPAAQAEAIPEETAQTQTEVGAVVQGSWIEAKGTCGAEGDGSNLRWELDLDGVLSISGSGAMKDYAKENYVPWSGYRRQIKSLAIGSGITRIGNYAFNNCARLTSGVTLPDSLTSIGASAFYNCSGLTGITFPAGLTSISRWAFYGCTSLNSITFPVGLTSIGDSAFRDCSGLTSVTFPVGLTSIGEFAFEGCNRLTGELIFPAGLTNIGASAFYGCTGLTGDLIFPVGLTNIGASAFYGCTGLNGDLIFPVGLTSIGASAFYGCTGLTGNLIFPTGLTSIGGYAFCGCSGFEGCTLKLPDGLERVEEWTFSGCGFSKITVPASVTYIGSRGLYGETYTYNEKDVYFSGNAPTVSAASGSYSSFSPYATLYFERGKTGWIDGSYYDPSTGRWKGYRLLPANEELDGVLAYGACGVSQSGTDLLMWKLYEDGRLSISGSGAMADYSTEKPAPWTGCADSISTVTVEPGVTAIGASSFYNCGNLTAVTFPASLTSIGSSAFNGCTGLTSLTFPAGLTNIGSLAFRGCTGLTSLTLPDDLEGVGNSTFSDCTGLTSLTLPDGLKSIGNSTFNGCTGLTGITFPASLTSIGDFAFYGCTRLTSVTLSAGLTSIGDFVFSGCIGLTSITLPDDLTSIAQGMFSGCSSLTSLAFPSSLTSIGDSAFSYCSGLTSLTFPAGLTSIGKSAFQGCTGLTSVTFPNSLISIGDSAFYGCTGLNSLVFPASLTSIGDSVFSYCSGLTSLTFPAGLTSIGKSAFQGCTGLTSLTYPVGLTRVGEQVFSGCTGLTSITFPNDLTSIGGGMFSGCTGLTSLTLPNGLSGIGDSAFSGCSGLTDISFPETLQSIGSEAFYLCGYSKITIPASVTYVGPYGLYCGTNDGTNIYFSGNAPAVTAANESKPSFSTDSSLFFEQGKTGWIDSSSYVSSTGRWNGYKLFPANEGFEGVLAHGTCGADQGGTNLQWKLYKDGKLSISGRGAMADYNYYTNAAPWKDYSDSISTVTVGAGVTSIGAYAFSYCRKITAITLPGSLTSIGDSAFSGCSGLTDITLPSGLTSIGRWAFDSCSRLTSVMFQGGLTSIGGSAFEGCTSLTSVMFQGDLSSIGDSAFSGCTGLTSLTLPGGLNSIGYSAFKGCTSLTSVTFQGDLTSIGDSAFSGCTALISVRFQGSLASIGNSTFQGCTALTSITLPGGLTSIGKSAFEGCSGLTGELIFPTGLTSIGDAAFYDCAGLTGITLPDGLTSIGKSAFYGCAGLTSITLPRALTDLGAGAFARTKIAAFSSESDKFTVDRGGAVYDAYGSLRAYPAGSPQTTYAIQAGTTKIYEDMFYGAEHLVTVMVPDSVGSIGPHAFYSMAGLEAVYFAGRSPSLDSEAFERSTAKRLKIYYDPDTTGWTEANWPSEYFERIKWNPHQATDVALDAQTLTLALGAQQKLTATVLAPAAPENTAVTWASANMDVAAVFADGTVLGKKAGTTTVTAKTADGGFTASCAVTVEPAPDGVMPVRLDSVCARPGNTVQVRLMLDKNPGFANLSLVIGYDADVMTLTKVENKVSGTAYIGSQTLTADPYMLTWNNGTQNCTASGTLATLTFQIKDTAAYGVYPISVSFYKGLQGTYKDGVNVNYDQSRNALPLVYVGSSTEIRSYIPGDINGDGRVDSRDVLNLLRHLSGWNGITVVEEALDVNGDGERDFWDATALLQYIAGWDVVLH